MSIHLHPNETGLLPDTWNVVKNRQCYKSSGCFVCCAAAVAERHNGIQLIYKLCRIIYS